MKKHYQLLILIVILLTLSFISLRGLLFTEGTIGHNWDWSVSPLSQQLQRMFENSFFTWSEAALGHPKALALPVDFLNLIFYVWAYLGAGGYFVSRLILFVTPLIAGLAMFFLLLDFNKKDSSAKASIFCAYLGAILFAFSPFLLGEFIGGAWSQFIAYALMPLPILFWRRAGRESKILWSLNLFLTALTLTFLSISTHTLIIIFAVIFLYSLFSRYRKLNLKKLAYILILFLILNLYWIIPTALEFGFTESFMGSNQFFAAETLTSSAPNLLEAATLSGYARPFTRALISAGWYPFWLCIILGFVGYCLYVLLRKPSREKLFWLFIFLGAIVFVTAGRPPLGNFVIWAFEHVPFLSGFRSIQHFIPATVLSLSIVIALAAKEILGNLEQREEARKRLIALVFFTAIILVWAFPVWSSGDFGSKILEQKGFSHIDSFSLSPGYKRAFWELEKTDGTSRVATLPLSFSPVYLETEYQKLAQGGDPTLLAFKSPAFFADFSFSDNQKKLGEIFERNISDLDLAAEKNTQILNLLGVAHMLYRRDLEPNPANYLDRRWYDEVITDYLRDSSLKKVFSEDYVDLYENSDVLPKIYANRENILVSGSWEAINFLLENESLNAQKAIYFDHRGYPIPEKTEYQRGYWQSIHNLSEIEAVKGEELWENKQNARTLIYTSGEEDFTELAYTFTVPDDGSYSLSVKLRYDTDEGAVQVKIDNGDWSAAIHPYFKTPYYTPGRDSWYYRDTLIGGYELAAGEHTITFRSRPILEKNLKKYKQGISAFSLSVSAEKYDSPAIAVPEIEFEKIDPTHYQAHIKGATVPFYLNFLEAYNSNWELRINNQPVSSANHFLVNGYANSWYVEEVGNFRVDIVYKTQELFRYSAWISGLAAVMIAISTIYFTIRRRLKNEHGKI